MPTKHTACSVAIKRNSFRLAGAQALPRLWRADFRSDGTVEARPGKSSRAGPQDRPPQGGRRGGLWGWATHQQGRLNGSDRQGVVTVVMRCLSTVVGALSVVVVVVEDDSDGTATVGVAVRLSLV